ncbi:MAG: 4Fe-4S binding protein [Methanomassiliicoccales archaeon]|nr:MAG: 4Fe-4S binding protein [Methanomassiliicoccales archaeon]
MGIETMRAIVDESLCSGCESCVGLCPTEAMIIRNRIAKIMVPFCKGCGYCVHGCGEEAIRVLE